jgi:PAS domain S-box-containing protein
MKAKLFSTRTRLAFALVCIHISILLVANELNVLPDRRSDVLKARATLCEAVALVSQQDLKDLEAILASIVKRDDTVLSAGVRRADGELLFDAGGHQDQWQPVAHNRSTETQLQVPIRGEFADWGVVEMRFARLDPPSVFEFLRDPFERLLVLVGCANFLLVYLYLGRMLRRPKRSQSSLDQFRSTLDALPVLLLVLDRRLRIMLANQPMASVLGKPAERLVGIPVSKLPWVEDDEKRSATTQPWKRVLEGTISDASTTLRLHAKEETGGVYMVNCRPIGDHNGKPNGVLIALVNVTQLEEQELRESEMETELANHASIHFPTHMNEVIFARR